MKNVNNLWMSGLAVVLAAACGADASSESADFSGAPGQPNAGPGLGGEAGSDGASTGGDGFDEPFEPESEIEVALQAPQGGDRFVFVVSTGLDAVVRIDAVSLEVALIEVGGEPTIMRTLGADDALVVVNEGTRDFSVVRTPDPEAAPEVKTLDAPSHVNRLEARADGRWAVAWYDPDLAGASGDLQQVLVLDLAAGTEAVYPVGVGFHPLSVRFDEGGDRAFVVTEDGVSVIDLESLTGPSFVPTVAVTPNPFEPYFDREVLVTPDGARAVVRRGGIDELRIVDLETGDAEVVPLAGAPTDVDLSQDGDEALVTIREAGVLVRVPLVGDDNATTLDLSGAPAGLATLTEDGARALLYSTLPGNEWLAVLDLDSGDLVAHKLQKGVRAVIPAPDGATALVLHDRVVDPEADGLEADIDAAHAYSVIDLDSGFVRIVLLEAEPTTAAMTPEGDKAWVLIPNGASGHEVDDVDLRTMLVTTVPMGSAPTHAVYVPAADKVAINQDHPVGRITFLPADGGPSRTVTGFELNGLIE